MWTILLFNFVAHTSLRVDGLGDTGFNYGDGGNSAGNDEPCFMMPSQFYVEITLFGKKCSTNTVAKSSTTLAAANTQTGPQPPATSGAFQKSTTSEKSESTTTGDNTPPSSPRVVHSTKNSSELKESAQSLTSIDRNRVGTTTSPETAYNWSSSEYKTDFPTETTASEKGESAITNLTFKPSKYRLNSTEAEQVRTGTYAARPMASSAAAPQSSLNYGTGITEKSSPRTEAAKSTITSTGTTLRSTSSAATPHSSSIYNSSLTSRATSMGADESTTTISAIRIMGPGICPGTDRAMVITAETTPQTTSVYKGTNATLPISGLGTRHQPLTIQETSTSKHTSLEAARSFRGIGATLPTRSSESAHQAPINSKFTKTSKHTSLEAAETTTRSTAAGEHRKDTVTSSLPSLNSGKSSKKSELTNAEQPTTRADETVTTTSAESMEHLYPVHGSSPVRRSTTAEPAGNTNTRIHHANSVTMSVSSAYTIHSTERAVEVAEAKQATASSDTSLLNTSFERTPESSTIQKTSAIIKLRSSKESTKTVGRATVVTRSVTTASPTSVYMASITNESATVKPTESVRTSKNHTPSVASSVPSSLSTHSTEDTSGPIEAEQPATGTSTVMEKTGTMPQSTLVASILTETTTLEPGVDTTLRATNYGTAPQSLPVYTTATTNKSTKLPGRTTRRATTMNRSYGRSLQSPFVRRTDITKKSTALESANNSSTNNSMSFTENSSEMAGTEQSTANGAAADATFETTSLRPGKETRRKHIAGEHRITATASLPSQLHASSTENQLRLARSQHSTTTAETATTITVSSKPVSQLPFTHDAAITNRSTASESSRRPRASTDADSYYADTAGTLQFVTPVTNAANITTDTRDTEEAATTTNVTTVITRSKAMPQSPRIRSARIGRKPTTLARNTSTGTDAEKHRTVPTFVPSFSSFGVSSTLSTLDAIEGEQNTTIYGGTDAGTLISSTEGVSRLRSYGDVYEKQPAKSTEGKGAVTSGMKAPEKTEETTTNVNTVEEIKTPWTTRELKSCEQCDAYGTELCEKKANGIVCHCYEHWSASCACDYGFTGEHCTVTKAKTTIISPHKSSGHLASEASVLVLTWYDIVIMVIKAILLIHSPSDGQDPQTHYQNCRSFVTTIAGFLALFFRHPTLFSLSDIECQWVFYIITSCCSLGVFTA
ncbi:unnamed protein product [Haemonchus placei]|uniref:EGF-like domain-containing protein n=1 Tax=Haemonchus placei TaxID=6290 RepID=A0A158QL61_HAEPC|nr:unnamed protein product [Haemonchus placei]